MTIEASSTSFDTVLDLFDPNEGHAANDDDGGGPGPTDSRIVHTLNRTGLWTVRVTNFPGSDPGSYDLSVACSGGPALPPAAPSNLTATAISSTAIELAWRDNSNNEDEFVFEEREAGGNFVEIGSDEANSTDASVVGLRPGTTYTYRMRARNAHGLSAYSNEASATTFPSGGGSGCTASATSMCLAERRFKVEVAWRDFNGNTGSARVVPLGTFASDNSGLFFFFTSDNWEMLVKVLDGCSLNDRFWVFSAATTTVQYTLRVTDTRTGSIKEYFNRLGNPAATVTDTAAFATCP